MSSHVLWKTEMDRYKRIMEKLLSFLGFSAAVFLTAREWEGTFPRLLS